MKTIIGIILSLILIAPVFLKADSSGHHEMAPGSPQFEKLKRLAGNWEGTSDDKKMGDPKLQVEYSLTSGGSVLVEKLFPGTPHEMVSMYHDKKGKLSMTHYCMMGNQPTLELKNWNEKQIELDLAKDSGIGAKEPHMHSLVIDFQDNDHITQKWTSFEDGKAKETSTFTFAREKSK